MILLTSAIIFILGLAIGSFLSVVVHRIHANKEGILLSRSVCPNCDATLKAIHLIPVLSWIFLRGKCAFCKKSISPKYIAIEIFTAILFLLTFLHFNFLTVFPSTIDPNILNYAIDWQIFEIFTLYIIITSFLVGIFFYDLLYQEIPDRLSLPAIAIAIAGGLVIGTPELISMVIGGIVFFLFFAAQFYISRGKWIGGGDLRMGILIGVILGIKMGLMALMLSYIIGALFSLILLISGKLTRKSKIAFGPFLVIAILITIFFGQELMDWYFGLIMV